jgi:hypothetical protein
MSVAIRGYSAEKKRLINESKLGELGYQKARVASREHNMERYKVCFPSSFACLLYC